jgi:tetratricopeptide (TPR) repeat protein
LKDERIWQTLEERYAISGIVMQFLDQTDLTAEFLARRLDSKRWVMVVLEPTAALLLRADISQHEETIALEGYKMLRPTGDLTYVRELAKDPHTFQSTLTEIHRLRTEHPRFALPYLLEGQLKEAHPSRVIQARSCEAYARGLEQIQDDLNLRLTQAACLGDRNRIAEAIVIYRDLAFSADARLDQMRRRGPTLRIEALLNLGLGYAKSGLYEDATKAWQEVLKLDRNNQQAKNYLRLLGPQEIAPDS